VSLRRQFKELLATKRRVAYTPLDLKYWSADALFAWNPTVVGMCCTALLWSVDGEGVN
jgi:hypothetical protein